MGSNELPPLDSTQLASSLTHPIPVSDTICLPPIPCATSHVLLPNSCAGVSSELVVEPEFQLGGETTTNVGFNPILRAETLKIMESGRIACAKLLNAMSGSGAADTFGGALVAAAASTINTKENIFCGSENDDVVDNSTLNIGLLLPDGLSAPLLERSLVLHDSFAAVDPDFITQNVEVVSDG